MKVFRLCKEESISTRHTAFQKALNCSQTQRISCEEKQECDTFDRRVHSWLSSLASYAARSTDHTQLHKMGGMYTIRSITQMTSKLPGLLNTDVLGLDLSSCLCLRRAVSQKARTVLSRVESCRWNHPGEWGSSLERMGEQIVICLQLTTQIWHIAVQINLLDAVR